MTLLRNSALGGALALAVGLAGPGSAEPPKPLFYGVVLAAGAAFTVVPHPNLDHIDGRYGEKGQSTPVITITRSNGHVFAKLVDTPPMEVIFDQPPPPRSLTMVFQLDASGRPVLKGFIAGDVGGEVTEIP